MDPIKEYAQVNRENADLTFGISRMEDIYDKRKGAPDEPHRHDFYTLLIVKKASGDHFIDFNHNALTNHQVYFISPGEVHQVIEKERSEGFSIVFSTDFLNQSGISEDFIENLRIFNHFGHNPPLEPDEKIFEELMGFCQQIMIWYLKDDALRYQAIGSYLKLICILCNSVCQLDLSHHQEESANTLLRKFRKLVSAQYRSEHHVSSYADELSISADYLNRVVKQTTGKTAKDFILSRVLTEAKRLLCFTNMSSKEIAYELGFSEPSHFSAFFKKSTGKSTGEFRKISRK